jgi:hypothetical protein
MYMVHVRASLVYGLALILTHKLYLLHFIVVRSNLFIAPVQSR